LAFLEDSLITDLPLGSLFVWVWARLLSDFRDDSTFCRKPKRCFYVLSCSRVSLLWE